MFKLARQLTEKRQFLYLDRSGKFGAFRVGFFEQLMTFVSGLLDPTSLLLA